MIILVKSLTQQCCNDIKKACNSASKAEVTLLPIAWPDSRNLPLESLITHPILAGVDELTKNPS